LALKKWVYGEGASHEVASSALVPPSCPDVSSATVRTWWSAVGP